MRRTATWLLCAATIAPVCRLLAGGLGSLDLEPKPLQLLSDRIRVRLPKGASIKPRAHSIMAAPEPSEEEARVVFDKGEKRLVLMAYETFNTAGKDFEDQLRKMDKEMSTGGRSAKTVRLLARPGFRVYHTQVTPPGTEQEANVICSAWVVNSDDTVLMVVAYANPAGAKDTGDARLLCLRILKTLAPGTRRLRADAGTRTLEVYSKTKKLALKLPAGYVSTIQRGPDFLVHRFRNIVPFGSRASSIGIYVGNHPSYHHRKAGESRPKPEKIEGTLLGKKLAWHKYSDRDGPAMEAIRPAEEIEPGLQLHVFFHASTEKELAALRKIVEAMEFVPAKEPRKGDFEETPPRPKE